MSPHPGSRSGSPGQTSYEAAHARSGPDAAELLAELERRGLTLAIAESLTGGLLIAEFIAIAGASAVVRGGVIAYATDLKHSLLGVDSVLLAQHGPVHADVARQMASGVRIALALDERPADLGLSTTGVAGPRSQDGHPAGEVFIGMADAEGATATRLQLAGDRDHIRSSVVSESLSTVHRWLDTH